MALADIKFPVGTVEELEKDAIDIAVVPSCARPQEGVVGCPHWKNCNLSIKGKTGPRNYAVAEFKGDGMGGRTIVTERDCQWITARKESVEDNGGVLKVVAAEGMEYVSNTSVSTDERNPFAKREYQDVTKVVAPYKRLGLNEEYANHLQRNTVRRQWRNEKEARREEEIIGGVNEPAKPLDAGLVGGVKGSGGKK